MCWQVRDDEDGDFLMHELNLVLHDARRINVMRHGGIHHLRSDAKTLSAFLGMPLWESTLNKVVKVKRERYYFFWRK